MDKGPLRLTANKMEIKDLPKSLAMSKTSFICLSLSEILPDSQGRVYESQGIS